MHAEFRYAARGARSGRRRLIAATIFVLLIFALDLISGGKVRALVRGAFSSVWNAGSHGWSAVMHTGYFSTRSSLESQIAVLQNQLTQEEENAAAYQIVEEENTALSQMTHLAAQSPGITAPIASSIQSSPYGTFLVGAGSADGITAGSLVLSSAGYVVGKISDVSTHTSLASELFAPNVSTDVVIDAAGVIAEGKGGGNAQAEIPRGISVNVGDTVIAPEYDGRAVGIVEHVVNDPAGVGSQAYIAFPVSLSALQFVYITP